MEIPKMPAFFYGWVVVIGGFLCLMVAFGVAYSFSAFFSSLQATFDASRGEVSLIFSTSAAVFFGFGVFSGPIADRLGARWVCLFGMVLISAGLVSMGHATALWQINLIYVIGIGIGVGCIYVPVLGVIQRWFHSLRGLASGIAVAGIGVGTLVVPFLAARLVIGTGWRDAYLWMAGLPLLLGLVGAAMLSNDPARRGLLPDGKSGASEKGPASRKPLPRVTVFTVRKAIGTRPFVLLYVAQICNALVVFIPFVHLAEYARDAGIDDARAVLLVGLVGIGSIVGRFGMAGLADRFGRRPSLAIMFFGMGAISLWWWFSHDFWSLGVFAVIFGVFYGGMVALMPALTADYFGGRHAGAIIGALYTSLTIGALLGPWLAGFAFDVAGSYTIPILASGLFNFAAVICIFLLPDAGCWQRDQSALSA